MPASRPGDPATPPGLLTVVTGPPCAGKSTWVRDHRGPDSVVLDLDALAHALGYPHPHLRWGDRHPAAEVARGLRFQLLRQALDRLLSVETWIIDTSPNEAMRHGYARAGADLVELDPGLETCLARAKHRDPATLQQIRRWYAVRPSDTALDVFG